MHTISIKIKVENNSVPEYKTIGAAGMDIVSSENCTIFAGKVTLVSTGLYMEIPEGFEAQVRPRSGLAIKHSVTVLNSPGTIDSDYRGEVKVILINHGESEFIINKGDRIAQIIFSSVVKGDFKVVSELNCTNRDSGGFGHTGV